MVAFDLSNVGENRQCLCTDNNPGLLSFQQSQSNETLQSACIVIKILSGFGGNTVCFCFGTL